MKVRVLFSPLILLVMVLFLAACGATDPAPTLPPPPTPVTSDQPPAIVLELGTVPADARETAVAESSPTPIQTPTLAPTATPIMDNEDVGQVEIISAGSLPALNQDLLFIADGSLKRWGRDGQVLTLVTGGDESVSEEPRLTNEPIVGDVTGYSLSGDGRRAAVVRLIASTEISNTVAAYTETVQTYELSYLNLETGNNQILVPAVNNNGDFEFQLSPDGKHLFFGGWSLGNPDSLVLNGYSNGKLYFVEPEISIDPKKVMDCAGLCGNLVWHQDNQFVVFRDRDALWLFDINATQPELILEHIKMTSDQNGSFVNPKTYVPISWASNGRYLLIWQGGYEGSQRAVLDLPTKQVMLIPNTIAWVDPMFAEVIWMQDDRVFVVRPDVENHAALGETFRVNIESGTMDIDETVVLSTDLIHPTAPMHWENGRFGYGLLAEDWNENVGLYQRIAFNEPAEQVNSLLGATFAPEIAWAADASGAAMGKGGRLYYAPSGGELYRLDTIGQLTHDFTWLP